MYENLKYDRLYACCPYRKPNNKNDLPNQHYFQKPPPSKTDSDQAESITPFLQVQTLLIKNPFHPYPYHEL